MNIDDGAVTSAVRRLSQHRFERIGVREALGLVVDAMPLLFSVDGAGILLLDDMQALRHVASSDGAAQILETIQEDSGRGPCVTALVADTAVQVDDIGTDPRWADLADNLVDKGIRAILGVPVHIAGAAIGSLNVYHREAHSWDESDVNAILAFDRFIEGLLSHSLHASRSEAIVEQLEHALSSRISIDRAVGMLMGLHELDPETAFELIRRSARSSRRTVEEVASEILVNRALN